MLLSVIKKIPESFALVALLFWVPNLKKIRKMNTSQLCPPGANQVTLGTIDLELKVLGPARRQSVVLRRRANVQILGGACGRVGHMAGRNVARHLGRFTKIGIPKMDGLTDGL